MIMHHLVSPSVSAQLSNVLLWSSLNFKCLVGLVSSSVVCMLCHSHTQNGTQTCHGEEAVATILDRSVVVEGERRRLEGGSRL